MRDLTLVDLNPHQYITTPEIDSNLNILLSKINQLMHEYGQQFVITSGLRSQAQQQALIAAGKTKATHSKHLEGAAADIYDDELVITQWLKDNPQILEKYDLYCEDGNKNWVHAQIKPFGSYKQGGTRWFKP